MSIQPSTAEGDHRPEQQRDADRHLGRLGRDAAVAWLHAAQRARLFLQRRHIALVTLF